MADENEQLIEAAIALDGTIHQKVSPSALADDVPEDATEVPDLRSVTTARFEPLSAQE
jgi:hypothetical protein